MQQFKDTDNNSENLNEEDKCAQGNNKRELECQLIKRLVNVKKNQEPVCYRLNETWALKYTNYLYENSNTLPGPIDNTPLLQIKEPIRNRDYFVLTDTVWRFLLEEYGGGPEILEDKVPPSPVSAISSTTERAKSADISMMSSASQQELPSEIPIKGLKNELFFCYMHSILQCLMCIQELNHFILNSINRHNGQKMLYCQCYKEMLLQIRDAQSDYIKINNLRTMISKKFNPKFQHDAQEFLLYLIMMIEDEIIEVNKEYEKKQQPKLENVVRKYLKGQIVSELICKKCKHKSVITEEFLTLSLALTKVSTVNQSLEEFLKDELIQDYKCDNCHKKNIAIKKTRITNLPRYLILHLKRFKFFPKQTKITQQIKFSIESNFCNTEYKLIGVIVHSGSLEQGHYYSFGRRQQKWWLFNDQRIKQANMIDVQQQQGDILFYQQLF